MQQTITTTSTAAAAVLMARYSSVELFKDEALSAARRFSFPGWNVEEHLAGVFGEVPLNTGAKIRRCWDRYFLERVGRREDRSVFEVTNWLGLTTHDLERRHLLTAVVEHENLGGTRTTRRQFEERDRLYAEQQAIREERRHRRELVRYQKAMQQQAEEDANWVPGLGDVGGDLADLSAALKFDAVVGDLTDIRRVNSSDAYAKHGRTTVRTKPAKTAANRGARRAVREALRRALDGDDVQNVVQRVGKPRFQYLYPGDPTRNARREEAGEYIRRSRAERAAWEAAVAEWKATIAQIAQDQGYIAAWDWKRENPEPTRPISSY